MTPNPATLRACKLAERAYQHAARKNEPAARAARLAAVHAAVADGWTQQRIADAMGKSRGWVGQRAPKAARVAADGPSAPTAPSDPEVAPIPVPDAPRFTVTHSEGGEDPYGWQVHMDGDVLDTYMTRTLADSYAAYANGRDPQDPAPIPVRALDRFRRTET